MRLGLPRLPPKQDVDWWKKRIGFMGVGAMGPSIVRNILKSDEAAAAYDIAGGQNRAGRRSGDHAKVEKRLAGVKVRSNVG